MKKLCLLWIGLIVLSGCAHNELIATPLPTLAPILDSSIHTEPGITSEPPAVATVTTTALVELAAPDDVRDPLQQYRAWIEEARRMYPYPQSADTMWQVMLCESSGDPLIEGPGELVGLFQYLPATWTGEWNPYRTQPITDAQAQIFATAKAWSDGNQHWWQICLP